MAKRKAFRLLEEAEVSIDDLKEDPRNANEHTDENLDAIEASLKAFGQPERLVARKRDGVVFSGNGRLTVMRRLKWKKARVQYVDGTDTQCRAYALAANQTTRMSHFNDEALLTQLQEIHDADLGGLFEATGFTLEDLTDMQALFEETAARVKPNLKRGEGGTLAVCPECHAEFRVGAKE